MVIAAPPPVTFGQARPSRATPCPAARAPRPRRGREAGVTLVEVLVVLALLGVTAGVAAISLRPEDRAGRGGAQEAELLAARLSIALEGSMVGGHVAALDWEDGSYRFMQRRDGAWSAHPNPRLGTWQSVGGGGLSREGAELAEREGRLMITPGALPPPTGPAVFALGGARGARVIFDGVTARVEAQ